MAGRPCASDWDGHFSFHPLWYAEPQTDRFSYLGMTAPRPTRKPAEPTTVDRMNLPPLLTRQLTLRGLYTLDALGAVASTVLCYWAAEAAPTDGRPDEPIWLSLVIALAIGLPVAVRRHWPYPAAMTATIAASIGLATEIIPAFAAVAPLFAMALVFYVFNSIARDMRAFFFMFACTVLVSASLAGPIYIAESEAPTTDDTPPWMLAFLLAALVVSLASMLGFTAGERRAQTAERNEQMLQQATVEERLRVARELHDVIAHTMTLIVVKASIGNHVAEADPREARDALQVIEAAGRSAMLEVRRVLDMLREDTPYAPAPGIDDIPALVQLASVGGVEVQLTMDRPDEPAVAEAPESVGLAVYRIVQEAITNVVKHAAPAQCWVNVAVGADGVRIEVDDDGKRPARTHGTESGHGLIGMRERVALHGGTFSAGPRAEGGFSVRALLPAGGGA
ncbi:sensor histidine kinase [Dactylosporangium matsuzakiense]|uniref:histidine kinase n=2 Tax=Dactylosporangium matsuzakiense TaxID=53360 RepID=A0A9W6NNX4_9ACTN|nr:two-component sensor histidine kinase [Dactylosporangium matsuzakiense]